MTLRDQIVELAKKGLKRSEIARKLNISKMEVLGVLCTLPSFHRMSEIDMQISKEFIDEQKNFVSNRVQRYEEIKKIILDLREKKMSFPKIADYLNIKGYRNLQGKLFKANGVHSVLRRLNSEDESAISSG